MKVDYLVQSRQFGGKLEAAKHICDQEGIDLSEIAYIGDDINCYDLLSAAGLAFCPNDAMEKIKQIRNIIILKNNGGSGVAREAIEKHIFPSEII